MKFTKLLISLMTFAYLGLNSYAKDITFKVEELKIAEQPLPNESYIEIIRRLILEEAQIEYSPVRRDTTYDYGIVAHNEYNGLVNYKFHSFYLGVYHAYKEHRPIILAPDDIWLLISQGFASHVAANAEKLRHKFVKHSGQESLIVRTTKDMMKASAKEWEEIFPQFTEQIDKKVGKNLVNTLTCNFSTSTNIEKLASEITIMKAVEKYFEFIVYRMGCGIPEITLQGNTEDWQNVLDKANALREYDLDWWINELEPILKEFVNASKGIVTKEFWRKMYKIHEPTQYLALDIIDGWFVKFFPYDIDGKRLSLDTLTSNTEKLQNKIVSVDVKYVDEVTNETIPLEVWAGFVGLEQNDSTKSLKPKIGWLVKKGTNREELLIEKFKRENNNGYGGIAIKVNSIPDELYKIGKINTLSITILDKFEVTDKISQLDINYFFLYGNIDEKDILRLQKLLPNTELLINEKIYNAKPRPSNDGIKEDE